ncbi:hypothetical protein [Mesorhizobium sp. B2-5-9]|nr:hypothetical protein [Mesorhizobium sp. B2-5-9]
MADHVDTAQTPSMDDKSIPSPPVRTAEQYDADRRVGKQRVGNPKDNKG